MNQLAEKQSKPSLRVAVTSYEGVLVNLHLGMADHLLIFEVAEQSVHLVERRRAPLPGSGPERWKELARLLADCSVLLTAGIGKTPLKALADCGLKVHEVDGLIEDALLNLYKGKELRMPLHKPLCRMADSGAGGQGCG